MLLLHMLEQAILCLSKNLCVSSCVQTDVSVRGYSGIPLASQVALEARKSIHLCLLLSSYLRTLSLERYVYYIHQISVDISAKWLDNSNL